MTEEKCPTDETECEACDSDFLKEKVRELYKADRDAKVADEVVDLISDDGIQATEKAPAPATGDRTMRHGWCFTIFVGSFANAGTCFRSLLALWKECEWMILGLEHSKDGRPHLQGACYLLKKNRFSWMKKLTLGAHLEMMRGTPAQSKTYCSKEDPKPLELGECPTVDGGSREKTRWKDAYDLAKKGRIDEIEDHQILVSSYLSLKQIQKDHPVQDVAVHNDPTIVYLYGVPGAGKSFYARHEFTEKYGHPYVKEINKWWDGYQGEKFVLIDDLSPEHMDFMITRLKIWCDVYAFRAETKGGSLMAHPELIVITSNFSLKELCKGVAEVHYRALRRRCREIVFFPFTYPHKGTRHQDIQEDTDEGTMDGKPMVNLPENHPQTQLIEEVPPTQSLDGSQASDEEGPMDVTPRDDVRRKRVKRMLQLS